MSEYNKEDYLNEKVSSLQLEVGRLKSEKEDIWQKYLDSSNQVILKERKINLLTKEITRLKEASTEGVRENNSHMKCKCTPDETTGWIQTKCCNICGKHVEEKKEDSLNKE
jgi:uncharacterized small protein (DUF1192 family)